MQGDSQSCRVKDGASKSPEHLIQVYCDPEVNPRAKPNLHKAGASSCFSPSSFRCQDLLIATFLILTFLSGLLTVASIS